MKLCAFAFNICSCAINIQIYTIFCDEYTQIQHVIEIFI